MRAARASADVQTSAISFRTRYCRNLSQLSKLIQTFLHSISTILAHIFHVIQIYFRLHPFSGIKLLPLSFIFFNQLCNINFYKPLVCKSLGRYNLNLIKLF